MYIRVCPTESVPLCLSFHFNSKEASLEAFKLVLLHIHTTYNKMEDAMYMYVHTIHTTYNKMENALYMYVHTYTYNLQ